MRCLPPRRSSPSLKANLPKETSEEYKKYPTAAATIRIAIAASRIFSTCPSSFFATSPAIFAFTLTSENRFVHPLAFKIKADEIGKMLGGWSGQLSKALQQVQGKQNSTPPKAG